jgi:hypothetical protein
MKKSPKRISKKAEARKAERVYLRKIREERLEREVIEADAAAFAREHAAKVRVEREAGIVRPSPQWAA